jgi:hypothetical protein
MQICKIILYLILEIAVIDKMILKVYFNAPNQQFEVEVLAVHLDVSGWNEVLQGSHNVKRNCATYEGYVV